jgi:hypothetical protein
MFCKMSRQNDENDNREQGLEDAGPFLFDFSRRVTTPPENPFLNLVANPSAPPTVPPTVDSGDRWQNVDLHDILVDIIHGAQGEEQSDDEEYRGKNLADNPPPRVVPWWKFWVAPNWIYYAVHPEREPKSRVRKGKKEITEV